MSRWRIPTKDDNLNVHKSLRHLEHGTLTLLGNNARSHYKPTFSMYEAYPINTHELQSNVLVARRLRYLHARITLSSLRLFVRRVC